MGSFLIGVAFAAGWTPCVGPVLGTILLYASTTESMLNGVLRRLEAMLAVADKEASLIITGNGDVLEPELGIVAIGSGGAYAQAAARALLEHTTMEPAEIVKRSLGIAGDLCIYTNQNHTIETLGA